MEPTTVTKIPTWEARVRRGAAFLDRAMPGWAHKIDIGQLAMDCGGRCLVGQLLAVGSERSAFRNFDLAVQALGIRRDRAYCFGFDLTRREWEAYSALDPLDLNNAWTRCWRRLQDAWIQVIADRIVTGDRVPTRGDVQEACAHDAATPNGQHQSLHS